MRRSPKISKLTVIFLTLAGIFNLGSFALDQQVVQQEDKLREINRKVNTYESQIETLIFGINTLENLGFEVYDSASTYLDDLDFQTKTVQIFNRKYSNSTLKDTTGNLVRKKFTEKQNEYLNNVYKSQLFKLKDYANQKIEDVNQLFKNTFSSGLIYEYLKESNEFKNLEDLNKIKIPESIFDDYNFNEVPTKEKEDKNYEIYSKFYNLVETFSTLNQDIMILNDQLRSKYVTKYKDYIFYLEYFTQKKNKKNYFILFSILSQILGLTFLLFLFRIIIKENY